MLYIEDSNVVLILHFPCLIKLINLLQKFLHVKSFELFFTYFLYFIWALTLMWLLIYWFVLFYWKHILCLIWKILIIIFVNSEKPIAVTLIMKIDWRNFTYCVCDQIKNSLLEFLNWHYIIWHSELKKSEQLFISHRS